MARHFLAAGHDLSLHSRSGVPNVLTAAGGRTYATPAQVAEPAETVFLMVPDTPHVEDVLFGANGVVEALTAEKTVVDKGSISPIATRDFAARIGRLCCDYVDAWTCPENVESTN